MTAKMGVNTKGTNQTKRGPMTEPLHQRIADELRKRIQSGAYGPGDVLPSEAELSRESNTSRPTVRHALSTLEQEGLIVPRSGLGRIVRSRRNMVYRPQQEKEPRRSSTMDRYMAALTEEGRQPSQTIDVAVVPAEGIVADRFGVTEGTQLAVRRRVRSIDSEPFNINDTYHLYSIAGSTEVMNPADVPRGSNSIIEDVLGPEVRALDELYIRMPTPEEASRLKLNAGTPVAVHYATGYTANDDVIRVEYFVVPGDRHVIVYERHHGNGGDV